MSESAAPPGLNPCSSHPALTCWAGHMSRLRRFGLRFARTISRNLKLARTKNEDIDS